MRKLSKAASKEISSAGTSTVDASCKISVITPPLAIVNTSPNCGSRRRLAINSSMALLIIDSIRIPSSLASGAWCFTLVIILAIVVVSSLFDEIFS